MLAVSEDDRLVCFSVYPEHIGKAVRELFKEFDLRYAEQLGVKVYRAAGDKDEIAAILSRDFWDDGPWDFKITDE